MIDTDVRVTCDSCGTLVSFFSDSSLFRNLRREGWVIDEDGERQFCSEECHKRCSPAAEFPDKVAEIATRRK